MSFESPMSGAERPYAGIESMAVGERRQIEEDGVVFEFWRDEETGALMGWSAPEATMPAAGEIGPKGFGDAEEIRDVAEYIRRETSH